MKILIPKGMFFYKHKNQTIQQTVDITEKENIQEKLLYNTKV